MIILIFKKKSPKKVWEQWRKRKKNRRKGERGKEEKQKVPRRGFEPPSAYTQWLTREKRFSTKDFRDHRPTELGYLG